MLVGRLDLELAMGLAICVCSVCHALEKRVDMAKQLYILFGISGLEW